VPLDPPRRGCSRRPRSPCATSPPGPHRRRPARRRPPHPPIPHGLPGELQLEVSQRVVHEGRAVGVCPRDHHHATATDEPWRVGARAEGDGHHRRPTGVDREPQCRTARPGLLRRREDAITSRERVARPSARDSVWARSSSRGCRPFADHGCAYCASALIAGRSRAIPIWATLRPDFSRGPPRPGSSWLRPRVPGCPGTLVGAGPTARPA